MECIVLAGGLGTRLRGVIGDQPKCMAPVNNQPFLYYLLQYLETEGCTRLVLSLGYKHEVVIDWIREQHYSFKIDWVIEEEPLGTGGGIQLALKAAQDNTVFILNGDTFFDVSLEELLGYHQQFHGASEATLALKYMEHFERYGTVSVDEEKHITAFSEKKPMENGWINGGVYLVDRTAFLARNFPEKFSFEKDYLEQFIDERHFFGFESGAYFIDIGVPEDYDKAQQDFKSLF